jgi:8-oxo-dGTP pyrophosphatase MutT (NUDIX family)
LPPAAETGGPLVRDAATLILVRRAPAGPEVLMGQRGGGAAFMPEKFVFPGGAVDPEDWLLEGDPEPDPVTARRLAILADPALVRPLLRAAVRELHEETGLLLGRSDPAAASRIAPASWRAFFDAGLVPDLAALRLVFRAITPPGRPRRFDARFFLADASRIAGAPDDFAGAGGELSHLGWFALGAARALPLPFVTEVMLAELAALLAVGGEERPVPFFLETADGPGFRLLGA